jgi:hypothetical protein
MRRCSNVSCLGGVRGCELLSKERMLCEIFGMIYELSTPQGTSMILALSVVGGWPTRIDCLL